MSCFVFFGREASIYLRGGQVVPSEIDQSEHYVRFRASVIDRVSKGGEVIVDHYRDRSLPQSWLVDYSVEVTAFGAEIEAELRGEELRPNVRWDQVILWVGSLSIFYFVLLTAVPTLIEFKTPEIQGSSSSDESSPLSLATTRYVLENAVTGALRRAEDLYSRSTLLLAAGIVMAFVGVLSFYATLPEYSGSETPSEYLPKAIRPTGILIFVESIAWFLLRQYRALIEDYKSFHLLYLKRVNQLAAYHMLSQETVRHEELLLAVSLLHEDLSGRLQQGETTEALEAAKIPDSNPVFSLLDSIVKRIGVPGKS